MSSLFEVTRSVAWVLQKDEGGTYPQEFLINADGYQYYEDARESGDFLIFPYPILLEKGPCANHSPITCKGAVSGGGYKHDARWVIDYPGNPQRVAQATKALTILNLACESRGTHAEQIDMKRACEIITLEHGELKGDITRFLDPIEWAAGFIHLFAGYRYMKQIISTPTALKTLLAEDFMWEYSGDRYDRLENALANLR